MGFMGFIHYFEYKVFPRLYFLPLTLTALTIYLSSFLLKIEMTDLLKKKKSTSGSQDLDSISQSLLLESKSFHSQRGIMSKKKQCSEQR